MVNSLFQSLCLFPEKLEEDEGMTRKAEIGCSSLFSLHRKNEHSFLNISFLSTSLYRFLGSHTAPFSFVNLKFLLPKFSFPLVSTRFKGNRSRSFVCINLIEYLYCDREKEQEALVREGTRPTPSVSVAVGAASTCKRADAAPVVFPRLVSENVSPLIVTPCC